jgi:hypothetical protein
MMPELEHSYTRNTAAMMDIRYWWAWVRNDLQGICPNCLMDLSAQAPEYNIAPHFMGGCKHLVHS